MAGASEVGEGAAGMGGEGKAGGWWVHRGKDTDEATILPGGFSHSLQLRSASATP